MQNAEILISEKLVVNPLLVRKYVKIFDQNANFKIRLFVIYTSALPAHISIRILVIFRRYLPVERAFAGSKCITEDKYCFYGWF
jgi:hypothetical protein